MKFVLIGLVLLVGLGYGGAKIYLYYQVSDGIDSMVLIMEPYAEIEYSGISSTLTGELTLDDVMIQIKGFRDEIIIGRLGIKTPNFLALLNLSKMSASPQSASGSPPEYFGLIAENIQVPATADYYQDMYAANIKAKAPTDLGQRGVQCVGKYGYTPKALDALGYPQLVMSISAIVRQAGAEFITEVNFDIEDMISVEVETAIAGNMMSGAAMGPAYQPLFSSMQMKLTDHSLNQRVVKYCTDLGLTPAQIQRAHLNSLQYFGKEIGIVFDAYVTDPYKEYLAGKSTFTVTARPREPIALTRIKKYRPSDVPALLNLEAIAQ